MGKNLDVAHQWANGVYKKYAGQNVYAVDGTIYSYGSHFPIARFYGADTVLFTSHDYSSSTARHKSYVRRAIPSRCKVFVVDRVCGGWGADLDKAGHKANHVKMLESIKRKVDASAKPRLRPATVADLLAGAERLRVVANDYRAQFKLGGRPLATIGVAVDKLARIEAAAAADVKEREEARRVREAAARVENLAALELWKRGEAVPKGAEFYRLPPAFRFASGTKGRIIETSLGAELTAAAARAAYPRLVDIRESLEAQAATGVPAPCYDVAEENRAADVVLTIGAYQVSRIDLSEVVAGCHRIAWDEVERLAEMLGAGKGVSV